MDPQSRPEHIRRYILGRIDNSFTVNLAGKQTNKKTKKLNNQPHKV